jgi:hypothetical protein
MQPITTPEPSIISIPVVRLFLAAHLLPAFSTTKGRTLHEKRVHGDQIGEQQGGTQQNSEEANDEETVASSASQAIIPFNPIPANII